MKLKALFIVLCSVAIGTNAFAQTSKPAMVTWQQLSALPLPSPDHVVKYGPDSLQFGELRLPEGKGPFPVVVVVHGGCWLSAYNRQYMAHVSQALTQAGYATWNIEFRRVGDAGGGYPGTFLDVALATDYVRELAKKYPVNAKQVAVIGHSAGGHLALWLAGRASLSRSSELYTRKPLKLKGVVSLAGIADLGAYAAAQGSCNAAVPQLMGGLPGEVPARYKQANPYQLLPLQVPQKLVQGALDPIVPVTQAQAYAQMLTQHGGNAEVILVPGAGHFDLVVPTTPAWPAILKAVQDVLPIKGQQVNR